MMAMKLRSLTTSKQKEESEMKRFLKSEIAMAIYMTAGFFAVGFASGNLYKLFESRTACGVFVAVASIAHLFITKQLFFKEK